MRPLREYRYRPEEIGRDSWPSGELRLTDTILVTDPDEADIFVCPGPLFMFDAVEHLDRFPHMKGRERRHVFFDCSDYKTMFCGKDCIFIRCNLMDELKIADPNSIPWPWPVDDYQDCIPVAPAGFRYDVSFHGWLSTDTRTKSVESCRASNLTSDLATYSDFCGYIWDTPEGLRRRQEFRRSMTESRLALCPESIKGVLPYRFYEAMSAGRVPVLVGSDYNLPFTDEIDYADCTIQCSRAAAPEVAGLIRHFLDHHSDDQIIAMGQRGRAYWEKWLNRERWPELTTYVVRRKLKEFGFDNGEGA